MPSGLSGIALTVALERKSDLVGRLMAILRRTEDSEDRALLIEALETIEMLRALILLQMDIDLEQAEAEGSG